MPPLRRTELKRKIVWPTIIDSAEMPPLRRTELKQQAKEADADDVG